MNQWLIICTNLKRTKLKELVLSPYWLETLQDLVERIREGGKVSSSKPRQMAKREQFE